MHFIDSPIPQISISLAPPEEPLIELNSPLAFPIYNDNGFRPAHLTPPPTVTTFKRQQSPLRLVDDGTGKGLQSDRFQALLKASKDRNSSVMVKKTSDLRKEIALKVHKNKQVERRALFLSKVQAPPSPTAAILPKTPPDSPAIFHYSLPSPGLVSPLALFESLDESRDGWVEQVDFRLPGDHPKSAGKPRKSPALPSLDQISARLIPRTVRQSDFDINDMSPVYTARPRPSIGVGRLRMPLRAQSVNVVNTTPKHPLPPMSPLLHHSADLHVTTLVVPRTQTTSPVKLTEMNLNALNSRGQRAHNMLSTLRRRTSSTENIFGTEPKADVDVKWRRRSAPAELMSCRARIGFQHPVLALPGAF